MWFKKWKEKRRARKAGREAINMNETTRDIQSPPETRYTEDYKEYIDNQYGGAPADNSIPLREMPSGEETKNEVRMDNNINVAALKNLLERRSIRKYDTERQVPKELLDTVLLAGQYAPTAMGKQSPKIVVVQNKEVRDCISEMNDEVWGRGIDPFYGAPTIIVVFADSNIPTYVQDGSLAGGGDQGEGGKRLRHAGRHAEGEGFCFGRFVEGQLQSGGGVAVEEDAGFLTAVREGRGDGQGLHALRYQGNGLGQPGARKHDQGQGRLGHQKGRPADRQEGDGRKPHAL